MAQHWTSRGTNRARELGHAFRMNRGRPNKGPTAHPNDADARRVNTELDAIRARFPDHA